MKAISKEAPVKDIHHVSSRWKDQMTFECKVDNHVVLLDKLPQFGGNDKGPRPKPLILTAISGCLGMEIVSILEKMRIKIDDLQIDVIGSLGDGLPKVYKSIHIVFNINCRPELLERTRHAIFLAMEKYCGVIAMVRQFAVVTSEINMIKSSNII